MNSQATTLDAATLLRKLRRQQIISSVLFLTLAGGILLYFLYRPRKFDMNEIGEKSFGPVRPSIAEKNMSIYRRKFAYASLSAYPGLKVNGVLHDTKEFSAYISEAFPAFIKTHTPMKNCVWHIGMYPMICKETRDHPKKPRIGIYFIPTMIDTMYKHTAGANIRDYVKDYITVRNSRDSIYYLRDADRPKDKQKFLEKEDYIFDEGHLWP